MRDEWEGPRLKYLVFALLLGFTLYNIALVAVLGPTRSRILTCAYLLGALYATVPIALLMARRQVAMLWSSNRRFLAFPFREARPRLEAAIASSGLPFREVASPDGPESARFEVGRGLVVVLLRCKDREQSVIHVSPVNDRTRRDVDGLKRSIDAAFPPAR